MDAALERDFETLYSDNYRKVYKLAYSLTGNPNDAEEISQEAFLRAFKSFGSFRGESSFFTWIYRIALNVSNDYLKQRKKMLAQALTEDLGYDLKDIIDENPSNDPETELLSREARFKCLHCLTECLPVEYRKIFCLAITLDLPHKLVAEIMDCSLSKVKTTLHRAKERWFEYMEDRCSHIKKGNPCNCKQWIRFGKEKGWFKPEASEPSVPPIDMKALAEVRNLRALREVYTSMYPDKSEEYFAERVKLGIHRKEWKIIS